MLEALHPRDEVDMLYVSRKEDERGLTSTKDSIEASLQQKDDYMKKRGGRMITMTRNDTYNTSINRKKK